MIDGLNENQRNKMKKVPIVFSINEDASKLVREYTDMLVFGVVDKYVQIGKYDDEHQNNETQILDAIIKNSKHLIPTSKKQTLNECFIEQSDQQMDDTNHHQTQRLNPIF